MPLFRSTIAPLQHAAGATTCTDVSVVGACSATQLPRSNDQLSVTTCLEFGIVPLKEHPATEQMQCPSEVICITSLDKIKITRITRHCKINYCVLAVLSLFSYSRSTYKTFRCITNMPRWILCIVIENVFLSHRTNVTIVTNINFRSYAVSLVKINQHVWYSSCNKGVEYKSTH